MRQEKEEGRKQREAAKLQEREQEEAQREGSRSLWAPSFPREAGADPAHRLLLACPRSKVVHLSMPGDPPLAPPLSSHGCGQEGSSAAAEGCNLVLISHPFPSLPLGCFVVPSLGYRGLGGEPSDASILRGHHPPHPG